MAFPRCRNVREADFKDLAYPLNEPGFTAGREWLRVSQGRYEDREIPTSVSFLYFQVTNIVFGDLTGDGKEEAAVVAIYGSNSGSFFLTDTYVFGCLAGRLKLIGVLKQSRIQKDTGMLVHESVKDPAQITKGSLFVTHGTEGARPSPEFVTTFRYKISGRKLLLQGRPARRKVLQ